jgi:hypothetical protein
VAPDPQDVSGLVVAEVKWKRLTVAEQRRVQRELEGKWSRCAFRTKHSRVRFEVLDAGVLER